MNAQTNGSTTKQDAFGTQEIALSNEIQASALAAQAEAQVKARWAIAQRNPRNPDSVRVALLKECDRPGFAEVAKYAKPVGKEKIVGPSIRFVEAALRCMGNVIIDVSTISEDRQTRRLQVTVTDLETNVCWSRQITIEKTVERKNNAGRIVLGERLNSYGDRVYVVLATEDELGNKEGAMVSKASRVGGLRVIPGDLIEEAMGRVDQVRNAKIKADPAGERKKLVDAFVKVGVSPEMLVEYLGHQLDLVSPAELGDLRDIYAALRDGETRWAAVMEQKREADPVTAPPPPSTQTVNATPITPAQPAAGGGAPPSDAPPAPRPTPTPTPNPSPPSMAAAFLSTEEGISAAIDSATSAPDLNKLAGPIGKLTDDAAKARCMAKYQEKSKSLRGKP